MTQAFDLIKTDYVDQARNNRVVPVKIYQPCGTGPFPLVMWSHGLGGTRDGAGFLARALAESGIMVVNIQHVGTDDVLWRGMKGHPWDNIKKAEITNETLLQRWRDVPFVLDQLYDLPFDWERIGYAGHSLGALSVQILCGQLWPDETGELKSFADNRIKHGLLYSPVPSLSTDHPSDVFASIDKPILHMTGTNDVSPLSGYGYEERFRIFDGAVHADRIMIVIDGADHMVFSGTRGQLPAYPDIRKHEELILALTCCYWSRVFKGESMSSIKDELAKIMNGQGNLDYRPGQANLAA